jgi:hypothetical protein
MFVYVWEICNLPFIIVLLLEAKLISVIPFSSVVSYRLQFPITECKISSLPIFALNTPTIVFVSCGGIL